MKIVFSVILLMLINHHNASAQLAKGTWLLGGNCSYSATKFNLPGGGLSSTNGALSINPNIGYFLLDKFVLGLKPGYERISVGDVIKQVNNTYKTGSFARYFFLPIEKQTNVFGEASYQYGYSKARNGGSTNINILSGNVGMAAFLNTSVALELSLGYSYYVYDNDPALRSVVAGIGLQFYLDNL